MIAGGREGNGEFLVMGGVDVIKEEGEEGLRRWCERDLGVTQEWSAARNAAART